MLARGSSRYRANGDRRLAPPALPTDFAERSAPDAPQVTIVTAALNVAAAIERTFASVAGQTVVAALEHVVVDGGSTDGTIGLVQRAAHRPRLLGGPDHGVYDAFNKGLAAARGEWIVFLGAGDTFAHPRVIEDVLDAAARHPDVDVLHGDLEWVDAADRVIRRGRFVHRHAPGTPAARADYAQFARALPIFHPTTFCRRRLFARVGGFDVSYRIAGDYDLLLRAWLRGATFRHLPEVLVRMRAGGLSDRTSLLTELEVVRAWRRHQGGPLLEGAAHLGRTALIGLLERRAPRLLAATRLLKRRVGPAPAAWGCQIESVDA